jgi:hypothetical protein
VIVIWDAPASGPPELEERHAKKACAALALGALLATLACLALSAW